MASNEMKITSTRSKNIIDNILIIPTGRYMAEVSWPAYSRRKGGTCDFMTKSCKKYCILTTNEIEKNSYRYFREHTTIEIVGKLIQEIERLESTILCWFVGSGDCPADMTDELVEIIEVLSGLGIRQHGFTRNVEFWGESNKIKDCSIVLTIEAGQKTRTININSSTKTSYLIAEPNYENQTVKISRASFSEVHIICGSGWVAAHKGKGAVPKVTIEDCSLCLKYNDGCFSLITNKKESE